MNAAAIKLHNQLSN